MCFYSIRTLLVSRTSRHGKSPSRQCYGPLEIVGVVGIGTHFGPTVETLHQREEFPSLGLQLVLYSQLLENNWGTYLLLNG